MTPDPRKSINRSSYVDKESLEASFHSKSLPVWDDAAPTPFPESQPLPEIQARLETPSNSLEDSVPPEDKITVESSDALIEAPPKRNWAWMWIILLLASAGGIGWVVFAKVFTPSGFSGGPGFGPLNVQVTQPITANIQDKTDYIATLESRKSVTVQPQAIGRINQIFVKSGDRVKAGTPLIRLDAQQQQAQVAGRQAEVDAARADIIAAEANLNSSRRRLTALSAMLTSRQSDLRFKQQEYERFKTLQAKGASSLQVLQQRRSELDQAQASVAETKAEISSQEAAIAQAQATVVRRKQDRDVAIASANQDTIQLRYFTITAPITGTVGDIPAKIGDLVNESSLLLSLTQNQALEINIEVPQEDVNELKPGMPVQIIDSSDQVLQTGKISYISPEVSATTQSVQVKAKLNNTTGLRTNQIIKARIIQANRSSVLVPTTAISRLAGKNFVFVAEPIGTSSCPEQSQGNRPQPPSSATPQWVAVQKPVQLGPIINNSQDILEGLSPSDRIITSGLLQLQNCMPIQPNS